MKSIRLRSRRASQAEQLTGFASLKGEKLSLRGPAVLRHLQSQTGPSWQGYYPATIVARDWWHRPQVMGQRGQRHSCNCQALINRRNSKSK